MQHVRYLIHTLEKGANSMAKVKDNQIIIEDDDGQEHLMEILFTYEHEERGKKYVFFFDPNNDEDVLVMSYNDEGELFPVDDDEEYEEIEEVFNAFQEDPEIQKIK